jgi:TetR/AcrR family transcriptional repressor of mexAB-oprM operon
VRFCKERKDADEHSRIILQKALALFNEHGVDKVSMHQIAKSAGIGQGTLYRRYAHKGELFMDILQESCQQLCENIELYLNPSAEISVRERLEKVLQYCLDFIEEKSQWLEAIQAPTCEGRRSILYQSPLYESIHSVIRGLLSEASQQTTGLSKDPVFAAHAILASMAPDLYLYLRRELGYSHNDISNNIRSLYLDPLFTK